MSRSTGIVGNPTTIRTVPRCGEITPLGRPVEPDVKNTDAAAVPSVRSAKSVPRTGSPSRNASSATSPDPLRATMSSTRPRGQAGSIAT